MRVKTYIRKKLPLAVAFVFVFTALFSGWLDVFFSSYLRTPKAHAAVASGIIIAWPDLNSNIPGGWARVTNFDTYFLEATNADPSATAGGSADHTHTSPSHVHAAGGHGHTGSTTGAASGQIATGNGAGGAVTGHTHASTINASSAADNIGQTANLGAASNDPPYADVIWIESDGSGEIPDGALAMFNSDTLPTNWTRTSTDRFLRGAPGSSGDGGAKGGSADSHTHTGTGHTHTENSHTHTGSADAQNATKKSAAGTSAAAKSHTHTISAGGATPTESNDAATSGTGDGRPPFYKLNIIENQTGGAETPDNIIAMWDQSTGSVPANWVICNNSGTCPTIDNVFILGASGDSQLGNTGGGTQHTHAAGATHTHSINSHTHNFTVDNTTDEVTTSGAGQNLATTAHTHSLAVTEAGGNTGTATVTGDNNTADKPSFKEMVFIQYNQPAGGSLALTASTSNSFDSPGINFSFTNQTAYMTDFGAIQVSDDRGGSPGWTLSLAGADWSKENTSAPGQQHNQLDFDGTGKDDDLGKLCVFPNSANLYAESGSLTGVNKQADNCYTSGASSRDLIIVANPNGTGVYWLTDMKLEQYFPGTPTSQVYTTTLVLTLSYAESTNQNKAPPL